MNNDLISRSALKNAKFLTPQVKVIGGRHSGKMNEQIIQAYQKGWNDCIDAIIDNAPTVEITETEIQEVLNKRCMTAVANEYLIELHKNKPQGEWKTVEGIDGDEYYECSNCGEPWVLMAGTPKDNNMNFCPNCGADMRSEPCSHDCDTCEHGVPIDGQFYDDGTPIYECGYKSGGDT